MPTQTRSSRAPSYGRGRFARSASSPRRSIPTPGLRRRRQPEPSGLKKVVSAVVPAAAAKKATPSSKKGKAGGLALIAAVAGMAFKNRDKLRRSESGAAAPPAESANTSSPTAGAAV
jgi:uncharacterized membrane protein YebE (DUF533 family)